MSLVTGKFGDDVSPRQALIGALEECDEYEDVIIVVRTKDRCVRMGWSTGTYLNHIGMLTFASNRFCEEMATDHE